ncbi:MAG TPA: TIGR03032 family protein, partial [Acidimicrobiales bacterium]|nr:TIGR03032 family protein [Acidimicrobiales bacterium]
MSDFQLVRLEFHETDASAGFAGWLADEGVSVAFTSAPRLFFAGLRPDGRLALTDRQYGPCSALVAAGPDTLFLATRFQVWRLENALPAGTLTDDGHDRLFVPQMAWTTGLLGVHDIAVGAGGEPLFVNGRFSCLSRPHERLNFEPVWLPPFVSALSPDDRCHLTGVAVDDTGHPAYVTCAAPTDAANGWRDHQRDGGVVVDVASGEIVCAGLSLPHSPRLRDGRLWLANAGEGQFGYVDLAAGLGRFEPVASVPGFARGVGLHGRFAVVG